MKKTTVITFLSILLLSVSGAVFSEDSPNPSEGDSSGVMPVSSDKQTTAVAEAIITAEKKDAEEGPYWGETPESVWLWVVDPNNKGRRVFIRSSGNNLIVIAFDPQNTSRFSYARLDLQSGEILAVDPKALQEVTQHVQPAEAEDYLGAIRAMLAAVNTAYTIGNSAQKAQVEPIKDYLQMIESYFVTPVPVSANWQARTADQSWNDSRGITAVWADIGKAELILQADFDANRASYGKGEVYIYPGDIPGLGQTELNMEGKKLVMEIFIPEGFINDPKNPEHLRLFMKSGDNWELVYGIWRKVDYEDEGTWVTMELNPAVDPASWRDANFNPARVWEFGVAFNKGSGQYQGDGLRIRNIRIEAGQESDIQPPAVTDTPPVAISEFIDSSGRNLNFDEYNYGWCVGEFPPIWGEGQAQGFSTPEGREKLRQGLLDLKSKGIDTVRLMALFGDLRTGIIQDENGNFIFNKRGNLQFDSQVYADVKAFFDVLHETGMQAVVGLFDFRIADDINREGLRNGSWAVGEHPEVLTDRKTQNALVRLFSEFFAKIYADGFVAYDLNDVVLFWEVMNEPESVCAVDFDRVISFHDRFFDLVRKNAPGAKVTTSSLSVDSAFRFWKDKVDVISVHHYPDIERLTLSQPVGTYGFGDKPVFFTEFGDLNVSIPDALNGIYASGAQGLLFWEDSYYHFSEDAYQSWLAAHQP